MNDSTLTCREALKTQKPTRTMVAFELLAIPLLILVAVLVSLLAVAHELVRCAWEEAMERNPRAAKTFYRVCYAVRSAWHRICEGAIGLWTGFIDWVDLQLAAPRVYRNLLWLDRISNWGVCLVGLYLIWICLDAAAHHACPSCELPTNDGLASLARMVRL